MDIQLKQRLLGAIIVLALIVIFVPMLFNKHQKEQLLRARAIPELPAQPAADSALPNVAAQETQVEHMLSSDSALATSTTPPSVPPVAGFSSIATDAGPPSTSSSLEVKLQSDNGQAIPPSTESGVQPMPSATLSPLQDQPSTVASPTVPGAAVPAGETPMTGTALTQTDTLQLQGSQTDSPIGTLPPSMAQSDTGIVIGAADGATNSSLSVREQAQLAHVKKLAGKTLKVSKMVKMTSPLKKVEIHAKRNNELKKFEEPYYIRSNLANSNNLSSSELKKEKKVLATAQQHAVGWVIQLGSFSAATHATQLIRSLRQKGFTAFAYGSEKQGGAITTKVYIGPFTQKAAAQEQLKKVKSAMKIDGFVTSFNAKDLH